MMNHFRTVTSLIKMMTAMKHGYSNKIAIVQTHITKSGTTNFAFIQYIRQQKNEKNIRTIRTMLNV